MPNIKDRILQIAKFKNISYEAFCIEIGMSYSSFKGNAKNAPLNSDAIVSVLSMCPDVDSDWLLTGKGEMLKNNLENFSEKNVRAKCEGKNVRAKDNLLGQNVSPRQYDPNDGQIYDMCADQSFDQALSNVPNMTIEHWQQALEQKDQLLAAKDELLRSKDDTIAMQKDALRLIESQINASTSLIEKLTEFLGNDVKKHPKHTDARDALDVDAPR